VGRRDSRYFIISVGFKSRRRALPSCSAVVLLGMATLRLGSAPGFDAVRHLRFYVSLNGRRLGEIPLQPSRGIVFIRL
jgi:hypothetical protein